MRWLLPEKSDRVRRLASSTRINRDPHRATLISIDESGLVPLTPTFPVRIDVLVMLVRSLRRSRHEKPKLCCSASSLSVRSKQESA